jgi:hypothetical protein
VTQPIQGYKKEGSKGLYKGIGKGLGGILIKTFAGKSQHNTFPLPQFKVRVLE